MINVMNGEFMSPDEVAAEEAAKLEGAATPEGEVYRGKPRKYRNKYFRINIPKSPEPGKKDKPVLVSPQGVAFLIHRGVDVIVPGSVVGVLLNAVETKYEQGDGVEVIAMDVPAYPVNILGPATAEEYKQQKIKYKRQNTAGSS